ncbi:extracellular solute-binding protein [Bifidobacterium sp.]|uniref:ABC transporter substrate-binding protein n=1 Tax=Bifidobacterium sp. TaxID=41200 RepID=UPI0028495AA3|nr:extracellular solute-binding protein [Bifidobacterium sp.]MDR3903861.1 extracellular solute-binding protein [Bifidobacterium sp.]
MTLSARLRRLRLRISALLTICAMTLAVASCGQPDTRTVITVWSWEPSMTTLIADFEKANPDVRVKLNNISGYDHLNSAIQDGYGTPDVVQLEYYALPQYAVSGQLMDLTGRVGSYSSFFTPGTWASVQLAQRTYALPMDSGPMAFFYNDDAFRQAGVDATKITTWDDYYEAAKKLKNIGVYIAADAGDASFYNAMIWLAGGRPFHTSSDGKTVTVDLKGDAGTRTFTEFWQRMIDEGLVNTHLKVWSEDWKRALGGGSVASVFAGAWMPSLLLADVPGTSGLWRVTRMPTQDGTVTNAENGGSALGVLHTTRKPEAAFRFVDYVCHNKSGIKTRVDGGAFPADNATLNSGEFLNKTTVTSEHHAEVEYFGGQRFNEVLSEAAESVSVGYQYLPFEVYARSHFRSATADAYTWSAAKQAYDRAKARKDAGLTNDDGGPITLPDRPGKKITLMSGIAAWQRDLKEYGVNQGFTIK